MGTYQFQDRNTGRQRTLLALIIAPPILIFIVSSIRLILYRFPVLYAEGQLLDQAVGLSRLENIYRPLNSPPWTVATYPPLFAAVQAPFVFLFGPHFWIPRLISLLSSVCSIVFVGLIVKKLSGSWSAAAAGGALFCAGIANMSFGAVARVDALAMALSLAALWIIARNDDPTRHTILKAALLLVAAGYTRQTSFVCALAGSIALLAGRGRQKDAIGLGLATLLLGGLVFAFLEALTLGGFRAHVLTANLNPLVYERAVYASLVLVKTSPLLFIASFAVLLRWRGDTDSRLFVLSYFAASILVTALIAKVGSDFNYCYEISAALAIAGALAWKELMRGGVSTPLLLGALALQLGWTLYLERPVWLSPWQNSRRYETLLNRLAVEIQQDGRPILADRFMGLDVMSGVRLHIQPFGMLQLLRQGLWDQSGLLKEIRDQRFSLIILDAPLTEERWTTEALEEIKSAYVLEAPSSDVLIFRPKKDGSPPDIPAQDGRNNLPGRESDRETTEH